MLAILRTLWSEATWPSGKAGVCKTLIASSILAVASKQILEGRH